MPLPRSWRAPLLKVHRWIAFSAGILLVLNALTGVLMLAAEPLDEHLNTALHQVQPRAVALPLEQLRQALRTALPSQSLSLYPTQAANQAMEVLVRGEAGWEGRLWLDPYTGQETGRRARYGLNLEGLFELHSSLLWGKTGKAILGFVALSLLFMLVSGALLWWPARWRNAFTVVLNGPRLRALFDLHRVAGATLGLWVAVCVATGGLLAYRPALQWINQLAGAQTLEAPKLGGDGKTKAKEGAAAAQASAAPAEAAPTAPAVPAATLDQMLATAQAAVPGSRTGVISLAANAKQPIRIRQKAADDPHPNGLTSVWLHPQTGAILRLDPWRSLAPAERSLAWVYPLHSGKLFGALGTAFTAIGGLALLGFGISGTWLWWLRRPQARARAVAKPATR